jgi:succinate-semialdehyde dehydrogenase/glutarate-semialdehyde dehydrogenase
MQQLSAPHLKERSRVALRSVNPATGETLATFDELTDDALKAKLVRASAAFATYRNTGLDERAAWLARAGEILEAEATGLGRLMTLEMGKPVGSAVAEARKCAWVCRYYAEHGPRFLADEPVDTGRARSFIRYQPLGPVLAIMPWNFPFWQVFRFAAPALMAGNVVLLKHASNVPRCALEIERVLRDAGFPEGVFQTLLVGSSRVQTVIDDARVRAITLTGSDAAGRAVAGRAGSRLKKTVLELGGSDPFIVMPSADLDRAVENAVKARVINNGQSCIAAKRFIIAEQVADRFEARFVAAMAGLRVGDPLDEDTDVGPLATPAILEDLERQVRETVARGARVLTGGERLARAGNYYAPTVLADVAPDSPAAREELFGPVATLFRADDIDDAIRLANDTTFGLGSAAWTDDPGERERFIDELDAGVVFINGMVASDPRLPFGGVKDSGYGRELSAAGIREFVNIKSIVVDETPATRGTPVE